MVTTATELAKAIRAGDLDPVSVVEDVLARICAGNDEIGAFRRVRWEEAVAEARALRERPGLGQLPLAGVPIAVKDVIAVEGEHAGWGSRAETQQPFSTDSDIAGRLRAAGAVIVGLTHVPELCLWPMTDTPGAAHDVLITPMLAPLPPKARHWSEKSWLTNALPATQLTAFAGPWDLAGYPAMSIPAGRHPSGLPIGIQLVAPPGGETRLLALAAQLESLSPWPRTAPH